LFSEVERAGTVLETQQNLSVYQTAFEGMPMSPFYLFLREIITICSLLQMLLT
jgi:hypothetical protein